MSKRQASSSPATQSLESWARESGWPDSALRDLQEQLASERAQTLQPLAKRVSVFLGARFPLALIEFMVQIMPRRDGVPDAANHQTPIEQLGDAQMRFIFDYCVACEALSFNPARYAIHRHLLGEVMRCMPYAAEHLAVTVPAYFDLPSVEEEDSLLRAIAVYFDGEGAADSDIRPETIQAAADECRREWMRRFGRRKHLTWEELLDVMNELQPPP
jgi:hypothetical protein